MSYVRGNNACYLVKRKYAIILINHTQNVKLIMLSSLPYPLFGNLQFFFCLNYLYNIPVVIHIFLELSYIVRTNYKAHYFLNINKIPVTKLGHIQKLGD